MTEYRMPGPATGGPGTTERHMAAMVEQLERGQRQLVALAECVSLAAHLDWTFLRRARLRFLPSSTAGLEADLCFSPLVEAVGGRALLLDTEAAEALRSRLMTRSPRLLRRIRDFTAEEHARAPRIVRFCEELLWSDLSGSPTARTDVARSARQVLRALAAEGPDGPERSEVTRQTEDDDRAADDLGRWALHYVARLPERILLHDDVLHVQVASCERLGLEPPPDPFDVERPAPGVSAARALVQRPVAVGAVAQSDGIVLSRPPAAGAKRIHAGGTRHRVRLDVTSPLAGRPEPVRLELDAGRSLRLPFTVVQRIGPAGELEMSLAHPGAALDVAVADRPGADPSAAHCAVLLADGTVVLYARDGTETRRVPPEARTGPRTGPGPERGPGPGPGPGPADRTRVALSADGTVLSYVQDGRTYREPVRAGGEFSRSRASGESGDVFGDEQGQFTTSMGQAVWNRTTATARTADGRTVVQAGADGRVRAVPSGPGLGPGDGDRGTTPVRDIGQAPWQVSSLAVSADGQRVAAVGNDALLIEWPLLTGADPRETRLRFCAARVFAGAAGSWVVAGAGGPLELSTEDGRRYRVTPDPEYRPDDDGVPAWGRGCALVAADGGQIATASQLPGVDCLAVPAHSYGAGAEGQSASWPAAAHSRGVRVVADLDVSLGGEADVLETSGALLDQGFDGLRLVGAEAVDDDLLDDVRHLIEGYDDRLLLYGSSAHVAAEPPDTARTPPALMLSRSLLSVLDDDGHGYGTGTGTGRGYGNGLGDDDGPGDGGFPARMSTLKLWIERALTRTSPTGSSDRWTLELGAPRPRETERLAAAVLLSLPGSPVLPFTALPGGGPDPVPLGTILDVRRNQLALSRGECRLLDLPAPRVLALLRRHGDESVLCLVNFAPHPADAEIDSAVLGRPARLLDLFDGSALDAGGMVVRVRLRPASVRWFGLLAEQVSP
ncbi:maltogenic amylase-like enzyme [Streptomyces sp. Amel2xB2]|uniref:alpha-glucosidase C-terminal domain-containing protein n=1 Tax=Streptomyces sp. Amel2xB2 TaxID=1305829 RepID=UPI000DC03C89|nr:alpha-glucosidase C-terminal domain-containing protein [Streptomyces sp. Amel2xB2]RAJ71913.1 maltogenic amylase-like enzyme [Streptomyces sp. Amel2xB2]